MLSSDWRDDCHKQFQLLMRKGCTEDNIVNFMNQFMPHRDECKLIYACMEAMLADFRGHSRAVVEVYASIANERHFNDECMGKIALLAGDHLMRMGKLGEAEITLSRATELLERTNATDLHELALSLMSIVQLKPQGTLRVCINALVNHDIEAFLLHYPVDPHPSLQFHLQRRQQWLQEQLIEEFVIKHGRRESIPIEAIALYAHLSESECVRLLRILNNFGKFKGKLDLVEMQLYLK